MARKKKMRNATIKLLRYTKWKCGYLERRIIDLLKSRDGEAKLEDIENNVMGGRRLLVSDGKGSPSNP
jgi:hypothetical protein